MYHASQGSFGSVSILLVMGRVVCMFPPFLQRDNPKFIRSQGTMISKLDYVEHGLAWTDACVALDREMND